MKTLKTFLILASFCLSLLCFLTVQSQAAEVASAQDTPQVKGALSVGQAVVLGVVEGLTEYLPVSSTGHLLLAERAMGLGDAGNSATPKGLRAKEASDAYAICIQAGAILAVFGLYFRRVKQMLNGLRGKDIGGRRLFQNMIVGFMPAAVIGLLFNGLIKSYLFGTWPIIFAWLVGGIAILVVSKGKKRGEPERQGLSILELTWQMALVIGFAQCIAMWPGVSRSLMTIVGGLLVGLSLAAAVEFSFLLGLITLSAATAYDALKHGSVMLQTFDGLSLAVGVIFAFISAFISVKWMVGYLNRHGLAIFGYYRIALALVVGGLVLGGVF